VRELASAKEIYRSIRESFPRTAIELASVADNSAAQSFALNKATPVNQWTSGVQRSQFDQRELRITAAGEATPSLKATLSLVGGEKVVVQYHSQSSQQFTPRPRYAWVEVKALGTAEPLIPVIDTAWEDSTELPVLQIPVRPWPAQAREARIRAWFRYDDPPLAEAPLRRGNFVPTFQLPSGVAEPSGQWEVEDVGGDAGEERRVTVTCRLAENDRKFDKLLEQAVWLAPAPDVTQRRYAKDGSEMVHDFIYKRLDPRETLKLRVATRQQFEQESYFTEVNVDVAN